MVSRNKEPLTWIKRGEAWMFLLTEIKNQIFRNKGRSFILFCLSALLTGCMFFYIGSIQTNQDALLGLSKNIPVIVRVVSRNGAKRENLNIEPKAVDTLNRAGVYDVCFRARAAGALSEIAKTTEPFLGGDTEIWGINCVDALDVSPASYTFLPAYQADVFEGNDPVCVINKDYASANQLSLGETISILLYSAKWASGGSIFERAGEFEVHIVGISEDASAPQFLVPATWLRNVLDKAGAGMVYDSYSALLRDVSSLNEFKHDMLTCGSFMDTFEDAQDEYSGDALSVEDELYVTTASNLKQNLQMLYQLSVPFYALEIFMIILAIFLTLRNCRRDIAIFSSLGMPNRKIFAVYFGSTVMIFAGGFLGALLIMFGSMEVTVGRIFMIFGLFLLAVVIGAATALILLLRFRTLALLTGGD